MSGYNPHRPQLPAPVNGIGAFVFTSLLPREMVLQKTRAMPQASQQRVLEAWDFMAEAARQFVELSNERDGAAPQARIMGRILATSAGEAVDTEDAPEEPTFGPYLVREVATIINRTPTRVRQLIKAGELEAVKDSSGRLAVLADSISDYGLRRMLAEKTA